MENEMWNAEWSIAPNDVDELWRAIGIAAFRLGPDNRVIWRGLASTSFDISSTLLREVRDAGQNVTEDALRAREELLLQQARSWDIGLSEHGRVSDLHLLAMLQHHGAPTRLIDVTYNPLTALWFACSDPERQHEPGVLAVITVSDTRVKNTSGSDTLHAVLKRSALAGQPVFVEPRPRNDRMKAQEGAFITAAYPNEPTRGPLAGLPINENARLFARVLRDRFYGTAGSLGPGWSGTNFAGIVISPRLKAQLLPVLAQTFNRSHRTMYPDVQGFADAVKTGVADIDYEKSPGRS